MRPADDIEGRIKQMRLKTSAELDKRVLVDAGAALEKSANARRANKWTSSLRTTETITAAAVAYMTLFLI